MDGLAAGTYTLLVEADGFADFEQEIEVDRNIRTAEIYAGFLDLEYEADSVHPGALLIGDADGNGKLDEKDKEFLIDSMSAHQDPGAEAEDAGKENGTADLNRDQAVDLLDLQYYAVSMGKIREKADVKARLTTRAAADAAGIGAGI